MAIGNFIPVVWAAAILQNLHRNQVYTSEMVINRDYEGDITQWGSTVNINNIGPITVFDYTKNTDMPAPEELTGLQRQLLIDQSKAFNFQIDDIDTRQQKPKVMNEAMREASFALNNAADSYVGSLYSEIDPGNFIGSDGTPIIPTATTAYETLVDLSVLLDDADVPQGDRFAVVPPWYHGLLLKDDRFVSAGTSMTDDTLRNGMVGEAAGMRIMKSTNVPNTGGALYKIIAGWRGSWSYAEEIPVSAMKAYEPESRFAEAVKGLHLYGAKVTRPTGLALLTASIS